MANFGESTDQHASDTKTARFERKALITFGLLCLLVAGSLVLFPSLWQALANPYETMTAAMATIAELCRW